MHGQCGQGKKSQSIIASMLGQMEGLQVSCGSCFSLILDSKQKVFLFGSGGDGRTKDSKDLLIPQHLPFFDDKNIIQIAAGTGEDSFS